MELVSLPDRGYSHSMSRSASPPRRGRPARLIGLAVLAALLLSGCGMLTPVTEQGRDIRDLYNILFVAAAVVFFLVEGAIVFAVLRYRRRDDELPPQFHGNNLLEVAWTVGPFLIVAALFVLTWGVLNRVDARADNPRVTVNVVAFQWQWSFTYAGEKVPAAEQDQPAEDLTIKGTIAKPPEIYLPVGEPIRFTTQARDVIHSFYVPEFLFKRDAFPDHENSFALTITKPGVYRGQCAEYCGLAHQAMRFTIHAVGPAEYRAWVEKSKRQQASGCPADPDPTRIAAKDIAFDKQCLSGPASRPFEITFDNQESVPHNVAFFRGRDAGAPRILPQADTPLFPGPKATAYRLPDLRPGSYFFHCDAHPSSMNGTLQIRRR
jgi:cytochrome c oxidase subunit II